MPDYEGVPREPDPLSVRGVLGRFGQTIGEIVTGGHPKTFMPELPSRAPLRVDLYTNEKDEATEVKAGGSKVRDYQIAHYQRRQFRGGVHVLFVQDPLSGRIGPDINDYLILFRRRVPYLQVWFTGVFQGELQGPTPLTEEDSPESRHTSSHPLHLSSFYSLSLGKRRGLRGIVITTLARTPMNGVELMAEVERVTQGSWRPTAGSMYPLLRDLLEQGIVSRTPGGVRYELSAEAKAEMPASQSATMRSRLEDLVNDLESVVSTMETARRSLGGDSAPLAERLRTVAKRIRRLGAGGRGRTS